MPVDTLNTEPDDLRASLLASYDEAEQAIAEPTPEPEPVADEPLPAAATTAAAANGSLPETAAASTIKPDHPTDPKRYADGSFKPQKVAAADTAPAATKDPSKDTQTQASAATAQPAVVAPPAGWTAAEKAEWSKLSPVAQAAVSRRESEIANGGKQWSEEKRRYEAMIAPVAESARARGMDVATGIQVLARAQAALDTDPVNAIKHIARSYGVDLATLAGTQAADVPQTANPPQPDIAALVRQAVQPLLAPIQQRYAAEEHARQQSTVDLVTTFATSPGHEHFEAVSGHIMALLPVIQQESPGMSHESVLQAAYDAATYANPTTRAAIKAAQDADTEAKRVEAAKQRTNAAKRAGSSVTGSPNGVATTGPKDTLRAEIEAAFAGG